MYSTTKNGQQWVVRQTRPDEIAMVMDIIESGRQIMRQHGNPSQWPVGFPSEEAVRRDIERHESYLIEVDGVIEGTFCFQHGTESTYGYIEGGQWPDDLPYCTIHRLATLGRVRGIGQHCIEWCLAQVPVVRSDTHADNLKVQQLLKDNGFVYCGNVYMENGTQRLAYQWNNPTLGHKPSGEKV